MACTAFSKLNLVTIEKQADGSQRTKRISLLDGKNGIWLNGWAPAILNYKSGGTTINPPMSDGITPVFTAWDDIIDTFTISASEKAQDHTIEQFRELGDFLIKAVAYWTTDWQSEPVWLEAKSPKETNTRYAVVKMWTIPGHNNPYQNPFFNVPESALANLGLTITHEPWASTPPGQPCPETRSETVSGCWPNYLEFDAANSVIDCGSDPSIDDLPSGGAITVDMWARPTSYGEGNTGYFTRKGAGWIVWFTGGFLQFVVFAGGGNSTAQVAYTVDSAWHHFAFTYDDTGARTAQIWIDGVLAATGGAAAGVYTADAAAALYIGASNAGAANSFGGDIGWVRYSDTQRWAATFTPPQRCVLPPIDANTVLQVIYEGTGTTTYDMSGNDNGGAITSADWACDCDYDDEDDVECNCVQVSGEQEWEYDQWAVNTALPVGGVLDMLELASGRLLASETSEVWRTDDGTTWVASTVPPATCFGYAMIEVAYNKVFLIGIDTVTTNVECWLSVDGGVNWALQNGNVPGVGASATGVNGIVYFKGDLYAACAWDGLYKSSDDGVTWVKVFSETSIHLCVHEGYLYIAGLLVNGALWRSDDGAVFSFVFQSNAEPFNMIRVLDDGYMYMGGSETLFRSPDGSSWGAIWTSTAANRDFTDIEMTPSGTYYLIAYTSGEIYIGDGTNFEVTLTGLTNPWSLEVYSLNGRVYAGETGNIWTNSDAVGVGRDATCLDEIMVGNKKNLAQLTQIFVYNAGTAVWVPQFPAAALPFFLFPTPAAANDYIAFGIETAVVDSGPFCSLVFDIHQPFLATTLTVIWEYSTGGPGWNTLNVSDGTDQFQNVGVNTVTWVPPTDWLPQVENVINALWVRARISALAAWIQSPLQQHRDVYTITWPSVLIDDAQVGGDISALLRIEAHNRSDEDRYTTVDDLDLLANRALVALRETLRGASFVPLINLAEDGVVANSYSQNPIGITVTDGTGTTTVADTRAPSGIVCEHTTTGNGLTVYDDAAIVTFGPSIARDFYGTFHAYVRAHLYEPAAAPAGGLDDVRVRLKIQTGAGGIVEYTDYVTFTGFDADDGAGAEERYNDFLLLDMGRVKLPVAGTVRASELPDEFTITVQIASDTSTNLRVKLYDLTLMPSDEMLADLQDVAFEDDSGVGNGYKLDADSVYYIKPPGIRALVRTAGAAEFITANYEPVVAGQLILQENADQKLHFLFARAAKQGEHTGANGAAILTDAYADFVAAGVRPGMIVYNVTDGSSATITELTETTITGTLAGGAQNDWDTGEQYLIVCPNWRSEPSQLYSIQLEKRQRYLSLRGET